jgi:hypothetical protein
MIADTIGPVVCCNQCNEAIPVPTRVLSLQNEIENRRTNLVFAFNRPMQHMRSKRNLCV